jgi:hypothetical protein
MNAAILSLGLALLTQNPSAKTEATEILYPYYAKQAAEYELFLDEERKQRLELVPQPVLTWTNADGYLGSVFVWTSQGRPEVIGCVGSRQTEAGDCLPFRELHLLGQYPVQPVEFGDGKRTWQPRDGIELADAPGAPAPADSERQRLTQMRNLAREFTGWMQQDGDVTELRLLPQPIFRYKSLEQDVQDGAIFAMVWKGTDPDVLLLLESREVGGKPRWQYSLARFNWREMWVKRNEKEVWRMMKSGLATDAAYISGGTPKTTLATIQQPDEE